MKIKITILSFLSLLTVITGVSQEKEINLDEISTPSSPASIIIGNQPSVINRPKTWNALETSLYSNFLNESNEISIPNNLAIEFTPYWADKKVISNEEFLSPSVKKSLIQNLSFSISSTQNFVLADSVNSNAVGIGFRTMLWRGTKDEKQSIITNYKSLINNLKLSTSIYVIANKIDCDKCTKEGFINQLILELNSNSKIFSDCTPEQKNKIIKIIKKELEKKSLEVNDVEELIEFTADIIDSETIDKNLSELIELKKNRKGFKLEFAVATSIDFPSNEIEFSVVPKTGVWLTPSYQPFKHKWIEFLGVFRYFNYNLDFYEKYLNEEDRYKHSFDYGVRLALKFKKYSIEFEGIGRTGVIVEHDEVNPNVTHITKSDPDFQYLLNFNYQINDKLILSYNFGKEFDLLYNNEGNLVSLFSLNYALNTPTNDNLISMGD